MQDWQKDLLTHSLSIQDNIEKSVIGGSKLQSLDVIEKGYKNGKISKEMLLKVRDTLFK